MRGSRGKRSTTPVRARNAIGGWRPPPVIAARGDSRKNARLMIDTIALAKRLIDIPSLSDEEGAFGEEAARLLGELGFEVERQEISSGRFNVFARSAKTPRVLFSTHLDTVPPFFPAREEGDFLFGRGACDTKGTLAAMMTAAERLLSEGIDEIGFLLVVAEETDSMGAKRANEHFAGRGVEFLINGEPTESKYVRASKGAFSCTLGFDGRAAHSAYPELGESAIWKMITALKAMETHDWGRDPILGRATMNVGVVRGGVKANVVPARAEADLIFRTVKGADAMRTEVESLVAPFGGAIVRSHGNAPTFMVTPAGEPGVTVAYNTDVPHLSNFGKPILFGPGSILDAHSPDEKIDKKEMLAAVDTYVGLVKSLLAGNVEIHGQTQE
jgi:acetylornithine deacetylase